MTKPLPPNVKKEIDMISLTTYSDIVMVGGLPTDIVIPYDSIHQFFISLPFLNQSQSYGPNRSWEKHRMLFVI